MRKPEEKEDFSIDVQVLLLDLTMVESRCTFLSRGVY